MPAGMSSIEGQGSTGDDSDVRSMLHSDPLSLHEPVYMNGHIVTSKHYDIMFDEL